VAQLELAIEELERVGAHGYRAEAQRALRRLGRRTAPRADGAGDLGSLSEREREIAELVARGRTNREIAAMLYVSEKTVERHLSMAFTKLGVARRTELALRVAADGRN
jgi:DNA-binding NarL/FixJ family response regulator